MRRVALAAAVLSLLGLARAAETAGAPAMNLGQICTWIALLASIVSAFGWLAVTAGRGRALPVARGAYIAQWLAMLGGAVFLWSILFHHDFSYQYVHDYSSKAMPTGYVFAAFWGGQEGTFLLWGLLSATLGLVLASGPALARLHAWLGPPGLARADSLGRARPELVCVLSARASTAGS